MLYCVVKTVGKDKKKFCLYVDLGGLNVRRAFCILRDRQGIK